MSRIEITNQALFNLRKDIQEQCAKSPAFQVFHLKQIDQFFKHNQMALRIMDAAMAGAVKAYAVHDEDGKPVTEVKDGVSQYTFIDSSMETKYTEELTEYLGRSNHIEV